jgi:molecular chaperone IbpA|tara:strand:+ start:14590 stop:15015 length:426 start_codon:yes stop_codon:yes gene_type:complete
MTHFDDVFGRFTTDFPFAIGFDRQLKLLERADTHSNVNYPPYNIVKHDAENFAIELAVAGFTKKDISISKEKEILAIEGKQEDGEELEYVHKGLASRSFKRTFTLADDIVVKGADMKNGILSVSLERIVPEEDKPQEIKIS